MILLQISHTFWRSNHFSGWLTTIIFYASSWLCIKCNQKQMRTFTLIVKIITFLQSSNEVESIWYLWAISLVKLNSFVRASIATTWTTRSTWLKYYNFDQRLKNVSNYATLVKLVSISRLSQAQPKLTRITNYEVQKISLFMIAKRPLHCGTNLQSKKRQSIEHKSWLNCIERVIYRMNDPRPNHCFFLFKSKWIFMIDFVTHSNGDGWHGVLPFLYHHFFIIERTKRRKWNHARQLNGKQCTHTHAREAGPSIVCHKINRKLNWQTNWLLCSVMTVKSLISSSSSHGHRRRQRRQHQQQQQSTNNNNNK